MYLFIEDYKRCIQPAELTEITALSDGIRQLDEAVAEKEIRSWLIQRFDCATEFTDTIAFDDGKTYNAWARVYLDSTVYDATATYALNDITLFQGNVYICIVAITTPEVFNPAKWELIGAQFSMFYLAYPYLVFDQDKFYKKGDIIFWKDNIYQAQRESTIQTHEAQLQAIDYEAIHASNVFPDDINTQAALEMWGTGVQYNVTGLVPTITAPAWHTGTYSTGARVLYNQTIHEALKTTNAVPGIDITAWQPETWVAGDNRSALLVKIYIDITIYFLSQRIAPHNVPAIRIYNYMGEPADRIQLKGAGIEYPAYSALGRLQLFAKGDTTAELPLIQPKQGATIRYGGNVKKINNW